MRRKKKQGLEKDLIIGVGERFLAIRQKLSLLQGEFAKALNISQAALSAIEKGTLKPNFEILYHLHTKFDISFDYIFFGKGEMKNIVSSKEIMFQDLAPEHSNLLIDLIELFKKSDFFRYKLMAYYTEFLLVNDRLLKKDIESQKKSTRGKS